MLAFTLARDFSGRGHRAFDSSNLTNELWNSGLNPSRESLGYMASFALPLVANGKVYAPTCSGQLAVYGLPNGPVQGDLNGDSAVNCADVAMLKAAIGKTSSKPGSDLRADVVRDGVIDVRDLSLVSRQFPPGTVWLCGCSADPALRHRSTHPWRTHPRIAPACPSRLRLCSSPGHAWHQLGSQLGFAPNGPPRQLPARLR